MSLMDRIKIDALLWLKQGVSDMNKSVVLVCLQDEPIEFKRHGIDRVKN